MKVFLAYRVSTSPRQAQKGSPGGRDPVPNRVASGFTLLELVAVLALMGLLMALVIPNLQRSLKRERDRAQLRQLAAALRQARSEATGRQERLRVFLDLRAGSYHLEGAELQGGLPDMKLAKAHLVWQNPEKTRGYIAFYRDGSSSGGKLEWLAANGTDHRLEVEVITGRVSYKTGGK